MNTKLLSKPALDTIDQYLHFKVDHAECSVPYFNNKRAMRRAGLRAAIGKGSSKEILDEVEILGLKEKIRTESWTNDSLKKFMCDNDIGIDCSGLAYYILAAENKARGNGSLNRHLTFPYNKGLRRFIAKFRPVENADVLTFANQKNSILVDLKDIQPGDFITMTANQETNQENKIKEGKSQEKTRENNFQENTFQENKTSERNHIVIIHQVDYQNFAPTKIYYTHSIAWPDDGQYGHGVRQGTIEILYPAKKLSEQKWVEKEKTGTENPTRSRALVSKTEVRRLKWWV
jgi:hypothetical protein